MIPLLGGVDGDPSASPESPPAAAGGDVSGDKQAAPSSSPPAMADGVAALLPPPHITAPAATSPSASSHALLLPTSARVEGAPTGPATSPGGSSITRSVTAGGLVGGGMTPGTPHSALSVRTLATYVDKRVHGDSVLQVGSAARCVVK